jgi:hypothetical protein
VIGITNATQIALADNSACALLSNGSVDCWGYDGEAELGDGNITRHYSCFQYPGFPCDATPVQVRGLTGARQLTANGTAVCVLTAQASEACWGEWADAIIDQGNPFMHNLCAHAYACSWTPVLMSGVENAVTATTNCALTAAGQIECWQDDRNGELGNGPRFVLIPSNARYGCLPGIPCSAKPVPVILGAAFGCDVPNLMGTTLAEAKQWLGSAGCRLGRVTSVASRVIKRGHVMSNSPGAGTQRSRGTAVAVVLSVG